MPGTSCLPLGQKNLRENVGKMAKNCMKITKSKFWGQKSGEWNSGIVVLCISDVQMDVLTSF